MSEFKVGDRVRVRDHAAFSGPNGPLRREGEVCCLSGDTVMVGVGALTYWVLRSEIEHVEPAPNPDYEQHAINHAAEAMRNASVKLPRAECNIASHEEMAAECTRLRAENAELKADNSDLRRRIEKLEKKR